MVARLLFILFFCFSGIAYANVPTLDITTKIAFDGNNTLVAITAGLDSGPDPEYALHYSLDFGKTWQHAVDGAERCVKWHVDSQNNTNDSFSVIRF